ncbi:2-keto-4-pentenoate hydratase/2-oxohepta-3-ene-1,7-dioic acid hydratase in catechol pathway [Ancylobacter aquaticus]|uniref:2-keto-4-pentenoate hydratase/2-oxohepta-3-ene-1,7-dioic acid hydratase in catechol pathway n=1 Tax=Ancylobacter aquaticus TaxID=100 RepID=A0A4R1I8B5_ANCAQ|nr:fumarylacetoacetate hydrolase family protein [Ancylobacter aquaticus]TCK30401.1 2-keto-4-pentenoate hydratase/2-oxohepta-3-ene-1,7-dioic acid hydratase in catechol pathway [Ancylobacter aquaticus]
MKLVSFRSSAQALAFGAVIGDEVAVLGGDGDARWGSLRALLERGGIAAAEAAIAGAPRVPLAGLHYAPVIPDTDMIFCVGLNYAKHIAEMGREMPQYAALFPRTGRSQIGHGEPMVLPRVSTQLDYEGELAFVIGTGGRYIREEDALSHVAGYSCYNDGSLRDFQRHTHQFLPGKNFWGTGAFGPWLVTPDEFGDVASHGVTTRLNGQVMQQAGFDDFLFTVPHLIAYISSFTELKPGDVVITGTPGGVGTARKPPVYMKPGDVVEVEIDGIGVLRNTVVSEADVTVPGVA